MSRHTYGIETQPPDDPGPEPEPICPSCGDAALRVAPFGDGDLYECRSCGETAHHSELVR
jgi:tRNA(Ile2) C34 agmatinyltransferase TiaS